MYETLVARVRYHIQKAIFMGLKEAESTRLLDEAADAIEELQKRVPKMPHGRLIDADALRDDWEKYVKTITEDTADREWFESFMSFVDEAPTIIPAEEGE